MTKPGRKSIALGLALACWLAPRASFSNFSILDRVPGRIITPNGDGVNDFFSILFDNPADSVISLAKIYDVNGAEVADFRAGSAVDTIEWDGRGRDGRAVRGGIYIYRVEVEGKVFSGTVVVAK